MTVTIKTFLLFSLFTFLLLSSCDIDQGAGWESSGGEGESGITVQGDGLAEKISWLRTNAQSGGSYTVELNQDESVYSIFFYFIGRIDITITIKGSGANRTITLLSQGNLLYVPADVTLILDSSVTLKGYAENIYPLVYIAPGGVLIMNKGAVVTGNISSVTGAVYVDGGTFTMNGGAISGNTGKSNYGSAVNVTGGSFTMNDGTISNNEAYSSGTVNMMGGSFVMNGGTISGNYAGAGGAVMVNRGTFTMNGGTISGNSAAINGGAVVIGLDGAFTMNGGTISGNIAEAYGGAVYVGTDGNFYMSGGTIYGNYAAFYGWGVYVSGIFVKNGGIISGPAGVAADGAGGAEASDLGIAVYAYSGSGVRKRRETTAGPDVNLSYSGRNGEYSGEWDF